METPDRRGRAHMGFFERIDTILNGTELNKKSKKLMTACVNNELKMLHNRKASYKYTDIFPQYFHWWMPAAG